MNSTIIYNSTVFFNESTTKPTKEAYEKPFGEWGIIASGIIIYLFLIFGVILNTLTILVIFNYPKLRNVFTYFIVSLCISDLMSAMISPLFWYRRTLGFEFWALPDFFCKLYWASDLATSISTAMHILSFSLIRYTSIRVPFLFQKITVRMGVIWILSIWFVSFTCGFIPFFIFFGSKIRDRESDSPDARWPSCTINMEWYETYTLFQKISYSIFIFIPICCVLLLSIVISYIVLANSTSAATATVNKMALKRRMRKDKQAVMQLILIVFSFLLGYIPFTVYEFWSTQNHPNTRHFRLLDYWMGMSEYFFIRLSECLNPIFYNLGSSKMRKFTRRYLGEKSKCFKVKRTNNFQTQTSLRGYI